METAIIVNCILIIHHSLVDVNGLLYMNDGMNSMSNAGTTYSRFNVLLVFEKIYRSTYY